MSEIEAVANVEVGLSLRGAARDKIEDRARKEKTRKRVGMYTEEEGARMGSMVERMPLHGIVFVNMAGSRSSS